MPDWKTRLAVSYQDESGTHEITPVESFTPTFALNAEVLNSIERTHIGVVFSPHNLTFTLTVKAIGDAAAKLTALALTGKRFDIVLQEAEGGHDWSFKQVVMTQCVITNAGASAATISGAPSATFSGFSLAATTEDKSSTKVSVP